MTRKRPWRAAGVALAALVAACNNDNSNVLSNYVPPGAPVGLVYQLNPGEQIGSDSIIEPGVLLSWLPPNPDSTVQDFAVFGSDSTDTAGFVQRAVTTSITFHDAGQPQVQYFVESQDVNGVSSAPSNVVFINPADTEPAPSALTGTPLDSAAELAWPNNSITGANGSHFDYYRVYSDPDSLNTCVSSTTVLEGTTVSNGFVITGIQNGTARSYFVTAVTKSGHESGCSPATVIIPSASDPSFSVAKIPGNFTVIAHHPVVLHRARTVTRLISRK
jgi:hypothetical protein